MIPLTDEHDAVAAAELDHEANQSLDALHLTMARFDPLNRAVLLLYLDERSHREIGEIVGIGESAVGTRINRIKQKLRRGWHDERTDDGHRRAEGCNRGA